MTDDTKPPAHYTRYIEGVLADPYAIADAYGLTDPRLFSALKKVLAAGTRGAKSQAQDVSEAINALRRWQAREEKRAGTRGFWGVFAGMEDAPESEVVEPGPAWKDGFMAPPNTPEGVRKATMPPEVELQLVKAELDACKKGSVMLETVVAAAHKRIAETERKRDNFESLLREEQKLRMKKERERDAARARVAELDSEIVTLKRERDEWQESSSEYGREAIHWQEEALKQERRASDLERVREEFETKFRDEQKRHYDTQYQRNEAWLKVSALNKRHRERKQSEEPAPEGDIVLVRGRKGKRWISVLGEHVAPDAWWTYPPVVKGE